MVEQGGDYALARKENQGSLYEGVSGTFALAEKDHFEQVEYETYHTVEKGHGCIEIRE